MAALLAYARKLEPVPARICGIGTRAIAVPECQTRVDIFPEVRHGLLWFYADVDARQSPTVAAFLAILFGVTNGQPPRVTLEIPATFVRDVMDGIGLAAREVGLTGILTRVQRHAAALEAASER